MIFESVGLNRALYVVAQHYGFVMETTTVYRRNTESEKMRQSAVEKSNYFELDAETTIPTNGALQQFKRVPEF